MSGNAVSAAAVPAPDPTRTIVAPAVAPARTSACATVFTAHFAFGPPTTSPLPGVLSLPLIGSTYQVAVALSHAPQSSGVTRPQMLPAKHAVSSWQSPGT